MQMKTLAWPNVRLNINFISISLIVVCLKSCSMLNCQFSLCLHQNRSQQVNFDLSVTANEYILFDLILLCKYFAIVKHFRFVLTTFFVLEKVTFFWIQTKCICIELYSLWNWIENIFCVYHCCRRWTVIVVCAINSNCRKCRRFNRNFLFCFRVTTSLNFARKRNRYDSIATDSTKSSSFSLRPKWTFVSNFCSSPVGRHHWPLFDWIMTLELNLNDSKFLRGLLYVWECECHSSAVIARRQCIENELLTVYRSLRKAIDLMLRRQ